MTETTEPLLPHQESADHQLRDFYEATDVMGRDYVDTPITVVQAAQLAACSLAPRTVLDLGCGAGANTLALFGNRTDVDVVGLDISRNAVEAYQKRTGRPAVLGHGERLDFPDASFDLVICDDVIEHVVDPDLLVEEIRRVLVPGGHLLLSTPNLAAWFNRIALLVGLQPAFSEVSTRHIFGRPGAIVVGHLRLFTARSLRAFLTHHRLRVVRADAARFPALGTGPVAALDGLFAGSYRFGAISVVLATKDA